MINVIQILLTLLFVGIFSTLTYFVPYFYLFSHMLSLPFGWISLFAQEPAIGMLCTQAVWGGAYGFPFGFVYYGGRSGCTSSLGINPITLLANLLLVFLFIKFVTKKIRRV